MKRIVKVEEVTEGEGLENFLDRTITLYCSAYIYTGRLVGINNTCVKLTEPKIVYETGELTAKVWKDAQNLPDPHYVQLSSLESFGPGK